MRYRTIAQASVMPPSKIYADGVRAGRWQHDPGQQPALAKLDRLHAALLARARRGWLARWFADREPVRGLYLWGGVGRGKTFLVDLFFDGLTGDGRPIAGKRRVHFHRFMGEVHARLKALGGQDDRLAEVARELAGELRVLVLDEFFVSDIGDAMILGRLLERLFAHGVTLVTTSNIEPSGLYRDGLQRARFEPAIALIERHCAIVRLDGPHDYRLRQLTRAGIYFTPADGAADARLRDTYECLTADLHHEAGDRLRVNDREIPTVDHCDGVAWFTFATLCEGLRAVADYVEIARDFHTVLLAGVPAFDGGSDDPARRFVHLVDELYDRHVNLVLSAAAAPMSLYRGARLAREFERTASRLIEMQSAEYLALEHRP